MYQIPEEDSEGNGNVFEVCVNLFSGELEREVLVTVADEDGSAIGELSCHCVPCLSACYLT